MKRSRAFRFVLLAAASAILSACGVGGDPVPPARDQAVTVTGDARVGVSGEL